MLNCQICNKPLEDSYAIDKEKLYHPACHSKAAGEVEEGLREVFILGCQDCGSGNLVPAGACQLCVDCGSSVGGC